MWRLTTRTTTAGTAEMSSNNRAAMVEIVAGPQQVKEPQEHRGCGAGPRIQEAILTGIDSDSCACHEVSVSFGPTVLQKVAHHGKAGFKHSLAVGMNKCFVARSLAVMRCDANSCILTSFVGRLLCH